MGFAVPHVGRGRALNGCVGLLKTLGQAGQQLGQPRALSQNLGLAEACRCIPACGTTMQTTLGERWGSTLLETVL